MKSCGKIADFIVLEVPCLRDGVADHIYPVVLNDRHERILVDCGYPDSLPLLEERAFCAGVPLDGLTAVIVTHHDYDHYGGLAALKAKYPRVQVLASAEEAEYIDGRKKSLRLLQAEAAFSALRPEERDDAIAFQRKLEAVIPVAVDRLLYDGDRFPWCKGTEIIATPGHMPGHISVYLRHHRTLITGDALIAIEGRLRIANPQYSLDIATARRSIAKLAGYDIGHFVCYHGGVVEADLSDKRHRHLTRCENRR